MRSLGNSFQMIKVTVSVGLITGTLGAEWPVHLHIDFQMFLV